MFVVCNCMYVRIGLYIYKSLTHSRLTTYIHKQTHIHTHKQTHIHTHKHTHIHTHKQTHIHTHKHPNLQSCTQTHIHSHKSSKYAYMYTQTNTHTHTHTHMQLQCTWRFKFSIVISSMSFASFCPFLSIACCKMVYFSSFCVFEKYAKKCSNDETVQSQFWHVLKYTKKIQNIQFSLFFQMYAAII